MKDKILSIVAGFFLSLAIVLGAMYFFTKGSSSTDSATKQNLFSQKTVDTIKTDTQGLQNYGNLPLVISGDQIGRGNPFDSYK